MKDSSSGKENLSPLEQAAHAYLQNRSREGLEAAVAAGGGMVYHFSRLYTGGGRPSEDVLQAGYEGLIKALQRYDPRRGVRFSTYAAHCVAGEIRHHLRREASFTRPGWAADLQARIYQAIEKLALEKGEPPSLKEIAEAVNVREEGIAQILRAGLVRLEELDFKKVRHLRYENFQLPVEDKIAVRQALERLGELQKKVIYLVFYRDWTQKQTADSLGISQRQVSRLLSRGLACLARYLT